MFACESARSKLGVRRARAESAMRRSSLINPAACAKQYTHTPAAAAHTSRAALVCVYICESIHRTPPTPRHQTDALGSPRYKYLRQFRPWFHPVHFLLGRRAARARFLRSSSHRRRHQSCQCQCTWESALRAAPAPQSSSKDDYC